MARSRVEVDLGAIRANAGRLVRGGGELWAVVKADGYGHGAAACAGAALAGGATRLCVATLDEAVALRADVGASTPVLVMSPLEPGQESGAAGLEICISSPDDLARLHASGAACGVHVKVDTGMGRWGMTAADGHEAGRALAGGDLAPLHLAGLMSHLATADSDPAFAEAQAGRFAQIAAGFPACPRHLANSAAALRLPALRLDAVRCGIALYGVSPDDGDPAADGLVPALRWTSRVAAVRALAPGDTSGYGRRLRATAPMRVALVPVGYADGYPRPASGLADVLVRGRRRRVAATVSMDQLTCIVDETVEVGDEVVLLGSQDHERVGPEELARHAGTIGYEIVCGAGRRARVTPRTYCG